MVKFFFYIILLLSILIFSYTFYKSEIVFQGDNRNYYITLYFISLSIFLVSIFSFLVNKKLKEYLLIIIISFIFTLYIFEIYMINFNSYKNERYNVSKKRIEYYYKLTEEEFDVRKRSEIFNDLKENDSNVSVTTYPSNYAVLNEDLLPLSSLSHSRSIYCNENGFYNIYLSDRYGFNNPDEEWDKDEVEYLLLGDSFVHGACVNRPNDIASILRKLSNKATLNLAMGSTGSLIQFATLREYIKPKVKNILWFFYHNDLQDIKGELNSKILNSYLVNPDYNQNLKLKQKEIDKLVFNSINKMLLNEENFKIQEKISIKDSNFDILAFLKLYKTRSILDNLIPISIISPINTHPEFKKIIFLAKNFTKANNSNFYFVFLPSQNMIFSKKLEDKIVYKEIKKIVKELDIEFIDIYEIFNKDSNVINFFPFKMDKRHYHYNSTGYKKIAEVIYEFTK